MTTEQTVVSLTVVVVNFGRIHFTSVSSTTCVGTWCQRSSISGEPLAYVFVDSFSEGLSQSPIVHCVATADRPHHQSFLSFVSNEEGTQLLSVRIDAESP